MIIKDRKGSKMTISEIIKSGKMTGEQIKRVSCVNVGFINNEGQEDETQLNVSSHILTQTGKQELCQLFASLVKELNTKINMVTSIAVIASADTEEELERMGF